jgi:paired amphipathic helix protein Sin3a
MLSEEPDLLKEVNSFLEDDVKFKTQKERLSEFVTGETNKAKAMEMILK